MKTKKLLLALLTLVLTAGAFSSCDDGVYDAKWLAGNWIHESGDGFVSLVTINNDGTYLIQEKENYSDDPDIYSGEYVYDESSMILTLKDSDGYTDTYTITNPSGKEFTLTAEDGMSLTFKKTKRTKLS